MTPTKELRTRLRKLLNERIIKDSTDKDTNFTDPELNELIEENDTIYAAASFGWTEKAALLQGDIEKYSTGDEQYTLTSLKDRLSHAMQMATHYGELGNTETGGAFMLKVAPPEVL